MTDSINEAGAPFTTNMNATELKTKEFLSRYFRNHDLLEDEDIFALGFVNSMMAMQLVAFVEKEFGITVEDEDLELDNFKSIRAIADLVERKRAGAAT
jgi:methoxymalonate biosynthesis acyl carrier protein